MKLKLLAMVMAFTTTVIWGQVSEETKVSSYYGVVHPFYTVQDGKVTTNFKDYYLVGLASAIIIKKAKNYAYNLELVGFIRSEKGVSKMSNFLLHPGVTRYFKKNFAITPRMGFETSGRFGPSLILTKTMFKAGGHPVNFNLVNLVRFGAQQKRSFTQAVNLTVGF